MSGDESREQVVHSRIHTANFPTAYTSGTADLLVLVGSDLI
jgi:hypothetical protein